MEKLSHAYIIASPSDKLREELALELAAKALCSGKGVKPCGVCRDCRKVYGGVHPDLTVIRRLYDDNGKQKREILIDQIREMGADAYVIPNEADGKVYIIEDADTMNERAQNAALKIFEEPPANVHFLLCAENPAKLLVTVRSRCVELRRNAEDEPVGDDTSGMAKEYLNCVRSCSAAELLSWCVRNEASDQKETLEFLTAAKLMLADMLCGKADCGNMSRKQIMDTVRLLDRCAMYLRVNTGIKHIFGLLAVSSLQVSGNGEKID